MARKPEPDGSPPESEPGGFREEYLRVLQAYSAEPLDGERVLFRYPLDRADAAGLPPGDRGLLVTDGLPRRFSMSGMYGSIRASEEVGRLLQRLDAARRAPGGSTGREELVILAEMGGVAAASVTEYLCLGAETGAVWAARTDGPERILVNSSLRAYRASLCVLAGFSRALAASVRETLAYDAVKGEALATACRLALVAIDPAGMAPSAFWPGVIDGELASWRPAPEVPATWPMPARPDRALGRRAKELAQSAPHLPAGLLLPLLDAVRTAGLSAADALIVSRASACVRCFDAGRDDYARAGVTRFGGDPDLPRDMEWPRLESPVESARPYLAFLGQLNLSDVPALPGWPLPRKGLLSVFVRDWEHANPPAFELRLLEEPARRLARRRSPPRAELCDTYAAGLGPRRAAACVRISLPAGDRTFIAGVARLCGVDDADAEDRLAELDRGERGALAQLLGHPDGRGAELPTAIALTERGHRAAYSHGYETLDGFERALERARRARTTAGLERLEAERPHIEWRLRHAEALPAWAAEWQLLLRVNSHDALGLQINDADSLYLFVRQSDLARGQFTSVAAETSQG